MPRGSEWKLPLGSWIPHNNTVHDLAPLFKVALQGLLGCLVVQATDEELAELLVFSVLKKVNQLLTFILLRSSK